MKRFSPHIQNFDGVLFLSLIPILLAGLATMDSFASNNYFFDRQIIWIIISVIIMFIAARIDWRFLRRPFIVAALFAISSAVLLTLFFFGSISRGAQSWFSLGLFAIQPADLAKLILIITLAKYFSRRHVEIAHYKHILISAVYALIFFGLVAMQPDFGSAVIIFALWLGMTLVSGLSRKHLAIILSLGIFCVAMLWLFVFAPYQKARILTFIDPARDIRGSGYNAFQSMVAVGSGELIGKGAGYGTQSRLKFLPEYQTDFIFAAFAEEWGFVGALLMFIFFGLVIWRVLVIAIRGSTNFEVFFCVGVAVTLMAHFIVNVGMNIGLLPVTGVTLPFMS